MRETLVTVVGRLTGEPTPRRTSDGTTWVRFRLAVGEHRFDKETQGWVEAHVSFVSVHCWRGLGDRALATLKRGDPVVVHGRLRVHGQDQLDQGTRIDVQVEAFHLGLDLSRERPSANVAAPLAAVA
ncbi:single-stranded DNA-binding protein [Actinokineospora soli]|uniref:Single-stranded DNA-binding protein n=1 Tax=Actinokineospora soli TaxID=1048753 RepID=A0ABW2TKS0_9PSEU